MAARVAALVRRALRGRRARTGASTWCPTTTVHKWSRTCCTTSVFDVKVHLLLSRHAAPRPAPARPARRRRERPTRPRAPEPGARDRPREAAGRGELPRWPRPASSALTCSSSTPAFGPGRHELEEARPRDRGARAAPGGGRAPPPRLGAREAGRAHAPVVLRERRGLRLRGDGPARRRDPHHALGLDAVTREDPAYRRSHGACAEGYLRGEVRGGALRVALRRRGARGDRGPRPLDGRAGRPRRTPWPSTTTAVTRTPPPRRSASGALLGRPRCRGAVRAEVRRSSKPDLGGAAVLVARPSAPPAARRGTAPSPCGRRTATPPSSGRTPARRRSPRSGRRSCRPAP